VLSLLFPGQGSQEIGMGRDVFKASAAARAVFEAADDALGMRLTKLCFDGPEEELIRTENQQPAILTTSIALLRALEERRPIGPAFVAGHSLGEYSALVASGALQLEDAVRTVHARGRFMQEAVPEGRGAMAAVLGATPGDVEQACAWARAQTKRVVAPANFNSPIQTVIAGDAVAVETACTRARQEGAKRTIPLAVSAPFHCELMSPAADKLALELARVRFSDSVTPVVTNVEAAANSDGSRIPELLERQVTSPVRFTEMVGFLVEQGVDHVLEIGPGRVLTGLVARCARRVKRANLSTESDLDAAAEFVSASEA
jgi:[acyl-carrier-protein] S-malonyltransferase